MYYGLINSMNRASASNPLWNNLLSYYTADNTPNDSKGSINGTLVNGATYGTGIINNGFSLDGVNDYVNLGNNFNFDVNTPFTFNFWSDRSTGSAYATLFAKYSPLYKGYSIRYDNNINGKIQLFLFDSLTSYSTYTTDFGAPNLNMNMITITYDGLNSASSCIIRINNINFPLTRVVTGTLPSSIISVSDAYIGTSFDNQYYKGVLDEIGIWSRVLTTTEITELYNAGSGKQYPL